MQQNGGNGQPERGRRCPQPRGRGDGGLEIEFDFIDHVLVLQTTSGKRRTVALEPRTVAGFYEATMAALRDGEGSFYAYAYPEPEGFAEMPAGADAAYYDRALGEFILPYSAVRAADDPDAALLRFLQNTYEAAAIKGKWDRFALESESVVNEGAAAPSVIDFWARTP